MQYFFNGRSTVLYSVFAFLVLVDHSGVFGTFLAIIMFCRKFRLWIFLKGNGTYKLSALSM